MDVSKAGQTRTSTAAGRDRQQQLMPMGSAKAPLPISSPTASSCPWCLLWTASPQATPRVRNSLNRCQQWHHASYERAASRLKG